MGDKLFTKILIFFLIIICSTVGFIDAEKMEPRKKNILLLNSYNKGYPWTDAIVTAIEKRIADSNANVNMDIEYINSKQNNDEQYYDKLYELYRYKYSRYKFDVIIASDDDAYNFLMSFHDELFPGVPIVFCSVSDADIGSVKKSGYMTGIIEEPGVQSIVNMIRVVHPNVERIHIITDNTTFGRTIIRDIIDVSEEYPSIAFTIARGDNAEEVLKGLDGLSEGTIVVLTPALLKNNDGNLLSVKELTRMVAVHSKQPVYSLWDFDVGSGIVGGMSKGASYQGDTAAEMALEILNGQSVDKIPPVYSSYKRYVFDYNALNRFGINRLSLPEGSRIINKPRSSYNITVQEVWVFLIVFIFFLAAINLFMYNNMKRRKKAEKDLLQSEGILRATLNATVDGILVTSLEKKIIDYNPLFIKMWEFPEEMVQQKNLADMLEYAMGKIKDEENQRNWVAKTYKQSEPAFNIVYLKDGKVFEVYSDRLTIQGKLQGRAWSFKDITERKRVEAELQQSEERYRRLLELSPDAIYMIIDGRCIFSNAAGLELLGACAEIQVYGRCVLDFMYDEDKEDIGKYLMELKGSPNAVLPLIEMKLKRLDDTAVDVEAATTIFEYDGRRAVLSVVRDITERKEAELLKERIEEKNKQLTEAWEYDKLKTEFFANISHELRTPINVILGAEKLFELFLREVDLGSNQEKIAKYINMMRQNCYRLTRLVNNLIDITRIDTGFFNINLKNYNIVSIVECITLSVAEYIQDKGITLVFDTDTEERFIACDADKIERIMLNLLSNAVKFTNYGGSISVNMKEEEEYIMISVQDTGIGIPEEKLQMVFDRFVQVDKSFVRNREGSGIGLSIVKSLVNLHGGSVELRSEINKGTTFEIRLPIVLAAEEEMAASAENMYQSSADRINVEFSDIYL